MPGCSDKTRGIIQVNARRKLKKTEKTEKKTEKTEKTEKPRIQENMPGGGGGSPHVPLNPWFFSVFQCFSVLFQFFFSFFQFFQFPENFLEEMPLRNHSAWLQHWLPNETDGESGPEKCVLWQMQFFVRKHWYLQCFLPKPGFWEGGVPYIYIYI